MSLDDFVVSNLMKIPDTLSSEEIELIRKSYNNCGRESFYVEAKERKVVSFIAHSLAYLNIDRLYWDQVHIEYKQRNMKILNFLDSIFLKLAEAKCKTPCLTENFGALLISESCIGCFESNDVDISISKNEIPIVLIVMEKLGIPRLDRKFSSNSYSTIEFDCSKEVGFSFWLNFIWMPLSRPKFKLCNQKLTSKRLEEQRYQAITLTNTNIRVLNSNAIIYFCALHIASGHFYSMMPAIRLYVDIDRPVRSCLFDWRVIENWAKQDNIGIRLDVVFNICNKILGTPIPLEIFSKNTKSNYYKRVEKLVFREETNELTSPSNRISIRIQQLLVELYSDGRNLLSAMLSRFISSY